MTRRFHWLPPTLVGLGLLAALATLPLRHRAEAGNRAVAPVLDYGQVRALAAAVGVPAEEAFRRFRSAGAVGAAVTEETLGELQAAGLVEARGMLRPGGRDYRLLFAEEQLGARVAAALLQAAGGGRARPAQPGEAAAWPERVLLPQPGGAWLALPGRPEDLALAPTGLDPDAIRLVRRAGLEPVGRLANFPGFTRESLRRSLERARRLGVRTVIFSGEEVLGYPGLVDETAAAFRDLGLLYGSVEFGKQRGDERLVRRIPDRTVRVHSIAAAEMARLAPEEAIDRYVRAAAERNIRLLYVRLPAAPTARTLEDSVEFVRRLSRRLAAEGFGLAHARPFASASEGPAEPVAAALMGLGVGAAAALLLATLLPLSAGEQVALTLAAGAGCGALAASGSVTGLQAVALLAALVFPSLAFTLRPQPPRRAPDAGDAAREAAPATSGSSGPILLAALREFAAISAVTLAGALMIGALLARLPFLIKAAGFVGIKIATVLPILLVGAFYLTGASEGWTDRTRAWQEARRRLEAFFSEPLRVWHAAALLIGIAALALLVARSGNEPGIGVSDLELRFRALLDRLLGVRPRTKEFLIGHPALILGLTAAMRPPTRRWALPLLLVGAIGQVGMLNSFCHLHTPLKLTLLRTFHGLWIGGLLGALLACAAARCFATPEPELRLDGAGARTPDLPPLAPDLEQPERSGRSSALRPPGR